MTIGKKSLFVGNILKWMGKDKEMTCRIKVQNTYNPTWQENELVLDALCPKYYPFFINGLNMTGDKELKEEKELLTPLHVPRRQTLNPLHKITPHVNRVNKVTRFYTPSRVKSFNLIDLLKLNAFILGCRLFIWFYCFMSELVFGHLAWILNLACGC